MTWGPDPDEMLGVWVTAATGAAPYTVKWGDGTEPEQVPSGGTATHTYPGAGAYPVQVSAAGWPATPVAVVVKDHAPRVYAYSDPDDDWRALLWVDEPANGTRYAIDWGDGSGEQNIQRDPPPYPRVPHDYTGSDGYTITVTDTATRRASSVVFDVGEVGMLFEFPADDATPHLVASRLRVGAGWELDWGDGGAVLSGTVPANASLRAMHAGAMEPGDYTVTVREVVDGGVRRTAQRTLTIPSMFNLRMQVAVSWRRQDADTRQITVTPVQTPADVDCTVNWGDGSAPETVAGGQSLTHDYAFPFPAAGWLLRVDETGGEQRHYSRLMGEPAYVGTARLSAWTPRAVDLYVSGIDGLSNADWYAIDWGDGHIHDIGAVGAHWLAWHTYPAPGDYTITLDGPGMAAPAVRLVTVPAYPTPVVTAAEDGDDESRMTTIATVDNTACGGTVTLAFGDGSAPETVAEASATPHQYGQPGAYTLIATCDADTTARARATATVPYGKPQTLSARVEPVAGNTMAAQVVIDEWDPDKTITVAWGDGAGGQITPPGPESHTYRFGDAYTVTVGYGDDSENHEFPIQIPWGE